MYHSHESHLVISYHVLYSPFKCNQSPFSHYTTEPLFHSNKLTTLSTLGMITRRFRFVAMDK